MNSTLHETINPGRKTLTRYVHIPHRIHLSFVRVKEYDSVFGHSYLLKKQKDPIKECLILPKKLSSLPLDNTGKRLVHQVTNPQEKGLNVVSDTFWVNFACKRSVYRHFAKAREQTVQCDSRHQTIVT